MWLFGDVFECVIGMLFVVYFEKMIWKLYGMVSDGVWYVYCVGWYDVGVYGFNVMLEDWGCFGEFVLGGGKLFDGMWILLDGWFD